MLAGDQAPSADLDMGQIAKAHLVIQQIAGWISQASGLIDGGDQPAVRVRACTAGGACGDVVFGAADLRRAGARQLVQVPGRGAGQSLSRLEVGSLTFPVVLLTEPHWAGRPG